MPGVVLYVQVQVHLFSTYKNNQICTPVNTTVFAVFTFCHLNWEHKLHTMHSNNPPDNPDWMHWSLMMTKCRPWIEGGGAACSAPPPPHFAFRITIKRSAVIYHPFPHCSPSFISFCWWNMNLTVLFLIDWSPRPRRAVHASLLASFAEIIGMRGPVIIRPVGWVGRVVATISQLEPSKRTKTNKQT